MAVAYKVVTNHPVALDSRDHTHPAGTMHDQSRNPEFNQRLLSLLSKRPISVMDLGCSGGSFVRDMLDLGQNAIGIEGSDYSTLWDGPGGTEAEKARRKPGKRAEWANIPSNLFTADITKPFQVLDETDYVYVETSDYAFGESCPTAKFDVVCAWEVMEHIPESGLAQLCKNVLDHLDEGGLWIMSVSLQDGFHHVTVKSRGWWLDMFDRNGFVNDQKIVDYFGDEWVRGPKQNAPQSFHLCVRRK